MAVWPINEPLLWEKAPRRLERMAMKLRKECRKWPQLS